MKYELNKRQEIQYIDVTILRNKGTDKDTIFKLIIEKQFYLKKIDNFYKKFNKRAPYETFLTELF